MDERFARVLDEMRRRIESGLHDAVEPEGSRI